MQSSKSTDRLPTPQGRSRSLSTKRVGKDRGHQDPHGVKIRAGHLKSAITRDFTRSEKVVNIAHVLIQDYEADKNTYNPKAFNSVRTDLYRARIDLDSHPHYIRDVIDDWPIDQPLKETVANEVEEHRSTKLPELQQKKVSNSIKKIEEILTENCSSFSPASSLVETITRGENRHDFLEDDESGPSRPRQHFQLDNSPQHDDMSLRTELRLADAEERAVSREDGNQWRSGTFMRLGNENHGVNEHEDVGPSIEDVQKKPMARRLLDDQRWSSVDLDAQTHRPSSPACRVNGNQTDRRVLSTNESQREKGSNLATARLEHMVTDMMAKFNAFSKKVEDMDAQREGTPFRQSMDRTAPSPGARDATFREENGRMDENIDRPSNLSPWLPLTGEQRATVSIGISDIMRTMVPFRGDEARYRAFKASYSTTLVNHPGIDDATRFAILSRMLQGEASHCISMAVDPAEGCRQTLENLDAVYGGASGNEYAMVSEFSGLPFHQLSTEQMTRDLVAHRNMAARLYEITGRQLSTSHTLDFVRKLPKLIKGPVLDHYYRNGGSITFQQAAAIAQQCIARRKFEEGLEPTSRRSARNELEEHIHVVENDRPIQQYNDFVPRGRQQERSRKEPEPEGRTVQFSYKCGPGPNMSLLQYTFPTGISDPTLTCPVCGDGHSVICCPIPSDEARMRLAEQNRCMICAQLAHRMKDCRSTKLCIFCNGCHSTAVCARKEFFKDWRNYPADAPPIQAARLNAIKFFRATGQQQQGRQPRQQQGQQQNQQQQFFRAEGQRLRGHQNRFRGRPGQH